MMKTAAISSVQLPSLTLFSSLHSGATTRVPKVSSQQHLTIFLSLTTALNHFITMLNHSNNELPAIFTSRDFGHVIYIFICNMELRDPAASVKHKINLVWPKNDNFVSQSKPVVEIAGIRLHKSNITCIFFRPPQ